MVELSKNGDLGGPGGRNWTISAEKKVTYDVLLVDHVFDPSNGALLTATVTPHSVKGRRLLVVDSAVEALYGNEIRSYFRRHGVSHGLVALPVSEQRKTMDLVGQVVAAFDEFGVTRKEPVIAVGGGVLLDVVGLAAGLYRRGTPYLRVPTTLIGLIDAGIGVKTGVNHEQRKSRLGAYHPPEAVLLDRTFLRTLDRRHIVNGLAEILKMAIVADGRLFRLLEEHGPLLVEQRFQGATTSGDTVALEVLDRAITAMLAELAGNLWEQTLDRIVDFGHSVSPLVEMRALPHLLHGEAVALDMALFSVLSCRRGLLSAGARDRVLGVMRKLGLRTTHPLLEISVLRQALAETTRHRGGRQRLPVPVDLGSARFVNDVSEDELALAAKELSELGGADAG